MATHEFHIDRSITIDAPAARVYPYVADLERWPLWSPWERFDPAPQRTVSRPSSGAGASYEWSGTRAGRGRMLITDAQEPHHVAMELTFLGPAPSVNHTDFGITESGGRTTVHWRMHGPRPLLNRMFGRVFDVEGPADHEVEHALRELKALCEARRR